jgi:hypothetical protein
LNKGAWIAAFEMLCIVVAQFVRVWR